jgi:GGDEF domain-containing protein
MGLSLLTPTTASEAEPRVEQIADVTVPPPAAEPLAAEAPAAADAETDAEAATVPLDPATGLVTREHAEKLLSRLAAGDASQSPLTVALVELAPIDWIGQEPNSQIDNRLVCGVSNIVRQSLDADHTLARFNDQQLLLLIPHEHMQQVTRRAEEMRQRVATTEFVAEGHSYQTTVTCALAEVAAEPVGPQLFEFLQEALDEAKRYGGNRTFMHDGKSPTPVVPAEIPITAQQLAI